MQFVHSVSICFLRHRRIHPLRPRHLLRHVLHRPRLRSIDQAPIGIATHRISDSPLFPHRLIRDGVSQPMRTPPLCECISSPLFWRVSPLPSFWMDFAGFDIATHLAPASHRIRHLILFLCHGCPPLFDGAVSSVSEVEREPCPRRRREGRFDHRSAGVGCLLPPPASKGLLDLTGLVVHILCLRHSCL